MPIKLQKRYTPEFIKAMEEIVTTVTPKGYVVANDGSDDILLYDTSKIARQGLRRCHPCIAKISLDGDSNFANCAIGSTLDAGPILKDVADALHIDLSIRETESFSFSLPRIGPREASRLKKNLLEKLRHDASIAELLLK